jgi:phosphocarrier protein HPr
MSETEVKISNRLGLHARAAARFVHAASRFDSKISVFKAESCVDGKSILGLLTLAASQGTKLRLTADGADEALALEQLVQLIDDRFGEES